MLQSVADNKAEVADNEALPLITEYGQSARHPLELPRPTCVLALMTTVDLPVLPWTQHHIIDVHNSLYNSSD